MSHRTSLWFKLQVLIFSLFSVAQLRWKPFQCVLTVSIRALLLSLGYRIISSSTITAMGLNCAETIFPIISNPLMLKSSRNIQNNLQCKIHTWRFVLPDPVLSVGKEWIDHSVVTGAFIMAFASLWMCYPHELHNEVTFTDCSLTDYNSLHFPGVMHLCFPRVRNVLSWFSSPAQSPWLNVTGSFHISLLDENVSCMAIAGTFRILNKTSVWALNVDVSKTVTLSYFYGISCSPHTCRETHVYFYLCFPIQNRDEN